MKFDCQGRGVRVPYLIVWLHSILKTLPPGGNLLFARVVILMAMILCCSNWYAFTYSTWQNKKNCLAFAYGSENQNTRRHLRRYVEKPTRNLCLVIRWARLV